MRGRRLRLPFSSNLALMVLMLAVCEVLSCGPGTSGSSRRNRNTKMKFKQVIPDVEETSLAASGKYTGKVIKGSKAYKALVSNFNTNMVFRDDEKTGDDRRMTPRCRKMLDRLAELVKAQWPKEGVRLRVIDAYDTDDTVKKHHAVKSLHHEGRAVDIATSDHDKDKYPVLGRLAYNAGFDWVYYASRGYIHASVKTEDDAAELEKGNYCFPETALVLLESGQRVRMNELKIGDKVETSNTQNGQIVFSEVLAFLDYKVNLTIDYVVIETDSPPAKLTITESHLLYKLNKQTQQGSISAHARDIKAGDYVYVRGNGTGLTLAQVTATRRIRAKGAYAPLTESGNVLVDNVLSSCYALVQDHTLAHWSFAPFRLLARFYPDFASGGEQTEGMHWYAKLLYGGYARWRYVEELVMNKYVKWFHNDMSMPLQATY